SSRRRHTRSTRDWSSDVCSSDLTSATSTDTSGKSSTTQKVAATAADHTRACYRNTGAAGTLDYGGRVLPERIRWAVETLDVEPRSEERRVGTGCGRRGYAWV